MLAIAFRGSCIPHVFGLVAVPVPHASVIWCCCGILCSLAVACRPSSSRKSSKLQGWPKRTSPAGPTDTSTNNTLVVSSSTNVASGQTADATKPWSNSASQQSHNLTGQLIKAMADEKRCLAKQLQRMSKSQRLHSSHLYDQPSFGSAWGNGHVGRSQSVR